MAAQQGSKRTWDISNGGNSHDAENVQSQSERGSTKKLQLSQRTPSPSTPAHFVIHRVVCPRKQKYHEFHEASGDYVDVPRMFAKAHRRTMLNGQHRIVDINDFIKDHGEIQFVALLTYNCVTYHERIKRSFKHWEMPEMDQPVAIQARPFFYVLQHDGPLAEAESEGVVLYKDLRAALSLLQRDQADSLGNRELTQPERLEHPYLQLYHQRSLLNGPKFQKLAKLQRDSIQSLYKYLDHRVGPEYLEAGTLFASGWWIRNTGPSCSSRRQC
ncbi:hypothetical protein IQ06DRAFT_363454 [Phaeosphaeriaceae sp. SRC1lsM3a]|nr:hypothetical protein IQ06DRAFT_363454 [Stagonospora sp. SRC1lsM3a]